MEKISKKDIQTAVKNIIKQTLSSYGISSPSTKTNKLVNDVSKKVSDQIRKEVKRKLKQDKKTAARQNKKSDKVKKINTAA